ncbi:hypothetical protein STVA_06600 [Allostella vacuolata]|nr:hypothetical protein STVA_06600 [Stella vacuolata]
MNLLEPLVQRPGDRPAELSVLMPVRNTETMVGAAVASVLGQQDCVAEILISDDQSSDRTLEVVCRTLDAWRGPHHVRVLRTTRRLKIDHLGALVAAASGRLLVQAHGDDVSYPRRLAELRDIHHRTGASLVSSRVVWKTDKEQFEETMPPDVAEGWIPLRKLVERNPGMLAGARYALDRRIYELFPPLDSSYLAIGHDALQPFRAALLGGAWFDPRPLLQCGRHAGQWTHRLWDIHLPAAGRFGIRLHRLGVMRAMIRDLEYAARNDLLPPERIADVRTLVLTAIGGVLDAMLMQREELCRAGYEPAWLTEEELARINREPTLGRVADAARMAAAGRDKAKGLGRSD